MAVASPRSPQRHQSLFSDLSLSLLSDSSLSWGPSVPAVAILTADASGRIVDFQHAPDGKTAREADGVFKFRCYLQQSQVFKMGPTLQMWIVDDARANVISKTSFSRAFAVRFRSEDASNTFFAATQEWKSSGNDLANGSRESLKTSSKFDKKIEASSAKMYFHYYGQLLHQQNMLQDYVRTGTYYAAVIENHLEFQGRVVVDVGAGTGILSLFAAQAGAKHVYAVEASRMAEYARKLVAGNPGLSPRITVIHGKIEEVELPEKADILISEPMGTLLVNERMLESYIIARDRFLAPNGKMFPSLGRLHMAPFSDEYLHVEIGSKALFWQQHNYYGVDLTALHGEAYQGYFGQPVVDAFDPRLLVAPAVYHTIDFSTVKEEDLYEIDIPLNFTTTMAARVHGLACWFDVLFNGSTVPRWLTTAPGTPTTHWYQLRCVLSQPLYVMAGQNITGNLRMVAHSAQSYTLHLTMSVKMWGVGAGQGGVLQTASAKLDLKEPYYRMSQPQAYSWAQDQQLQQFQLQQQANQSSQQPQLTVSSSTQQSESATGMQQPSTPMQASLTSSMLMHQQQLQQQQVQPAQQQFVVPMQQQVQPAQQQFVVPLQQQQPPTQFFQPNVWGSS